MNTRQVQNCVQPEFVLGRVSVFHGILQLARAVLKNIHIRRERRELYRHFSRLDEKSLRDIGMHDPNTQLKTLGRYL